MSRKGQIQIAVGGFYGEVFKNSPATSPDYILDMIWRVAKELG